MQYKVFNDEVYYTDEDIIKVSQADIALLKEKAMQNPRERVRLCSHRDVDDVVHEMLIVHT